MSLGVAPPQFELVADHGREVVQVCCKRREPASRTVRS